jgi:hypothetical protein
VLLPSIDEAQRFRAELELARPPIPPPLTQEELLKLARDAYAPLWRALFDYNQAISKENGETVDCTCTSVDEDTRVITGAIQFTRGDRSRIHPFVIEGYQIAMPTFPRQYEVSNTYKTEDIDELIDRLRSDLVAFLTE